MGQEEQIIRRREINATQHAQIKRVNLHREMMDKFKSLGEKKIEKFLCCTPIVYTCKQTCKMLKAKG
jgi:hypothetical protein